MPRDPVVFVPEGDSTLRENLTELLSRLELEVLAFSEEGSFQELRGVERPCCIVLDASSPGCCALQKRLAAEGLEVPVVVLVEEWDVPSAVAAMRAGADDVLEKQFVAQSLPTRIRRYLAEERGEDGRSECAARLARLTERERQVMRRIVAGDSNRKIALDLGIGVKAVEKHRAQVMRKIEVDNLAQLVRIALRFGDGQP